MEKKKIDRSVSDLLKPHVDFRELTPIWFDLPLSFYKRLRRTAEKTGISQVELIKRGLVLAAEEAEREGKEYREIGDVMEGVRKGRWVKKTPEERREHAAKMAKARWGDDGQK